MNDVEIFNYLLNQINRELQKTPLNFNSHDFNNLIKELKSLINKTYKKYAINHGFYEKEIIYNQRLFESNIKTVYFNYLITTIFRYLSKSGKLRRKQAWELTDEVTYDEPTNRLIISGVVYELNNMTFSEIKEVILKAITTLEVKEKFQSLTREEKLEIALKCNKLSSSRKLRIIDVVLIELSNAIDSNTINSLVLSGISINKKWNTQGDSRVRSTHKKIDGDEVSLSDFFDVGGHEAQYPRDRTLPAKEKINCRCFLTYE